MSSRIESGAEKIVAEFRELLGESLAAQIDPSHFSELQQLIQQGIEQEINHIADEVSALAESLRQRSEKASIEL